MARSKLVMTVLGAAAALAAAGCGSVAAGASHAGAASGSGSATGGPAATPSSTASPGQVNGTGGPIALAGQLCSAPGSVSQVSVTRTGVADPVLPSGPRVAAFVTSATSASPGPVVKGAAQASALAKAVCGLPAVTGGVVHCPLESTDGYRLFFTSDGRLLPVVIVQASGCRTVIGAGPARSAASSPAFLKLLASMAGPVALPGAGHLPGTSVSGDPLRALGTAPA